MSTLLHVILDRAPALATLAQECKGCPGTLCKGCHGTEHEGGCPYVSFGALFFDLIIAHSFSVSSRPSAVNSPAPCSHSPPSMVTTSPLMYPEPSLTRNAAKLANSSMVPNRPRGIRFFAASSSSGRGNKRENAPSVGIGPGAMAFIRIPRLPHSTARLRVSACTPAFATADGTTYAEPVVVYVVVMLSTTPPRFAASQRRPQAIVVWSVPIRTMPITD